LDDFKLLYSLTFEICGELHHIFDVFIVLIAYLQTDLLGHIIENGGIIGGL